MFEAKEIILQNNDWVTFVFLAILLFLTTAKVLFSDRLLHLSTLFLSNKYFLIYFNKEKNNLLNLFQILLFVVQLLVLSLLLYYINAYFQLKPEFSGLNNYLLIIVGVSLYVGLRFFSGIFLAYIFNLKEVHKKLTNEKVNYLNNLILWLIPLLVVHEYITYYKNFILIIAFLIVILLLVIRYGLLLSNNKKLFFNDLFYFIMYLCALEIAPLIIFFKLII